MQIHKNVFILGLALGLGLRAKIFGLGLEA